MMNFLSLLGTILFYGVITAIVASAIYAVIFAIVDSRNDQPYGMCGFIRRHKVARNKNGQYTCKYCGRTKFSLDKELSKKRKAEK